MGQHDDATGRWPSPHFDVVATAPAAASYSVLAAVKVPARPVVVATVRASAFPVTAILVPVVPVFVAVVTAAVASAEDFRNLHISPLFPIPGMLPRKASWCSRARRSRDSGQARGSAARNPLTVPLSRNTCDNSPHPPPETSLDSEKVLHREELLRAVAEGFPLQAAPHPGSRIVRGMATIGI